MAWDYAPCSKARDQVKECHKDQRREPENDTYHASIIAIPTLHLLAHLKPHALIDLHIGHTLRTFQITLDPLPIRPLPRTKAGRPRSPAPRDSQQQYCKSSSHADHPRSATALPAAAASRSSTDSHADPRARSGGHWSGTD